jgi:hypothetical protein
LAPGSDAPTLSRKPTVVKDQGHALPALEQVPVDGPTGGFFGRDGAEPW